MTTREIAALVEISKRWNARRYLKELQKKRLVVCISDSVKRARLYARTEKGLKYLIKIKENYLYDALLKRIDVNWDAYAWVLNSKRRQDILKAIEKDNPKTVQQIRIDSRKREGEESSLRELENRLSAAKTREILKDFSEKRIVQVIKKKHKRRLFTITEKGEKILEMLLK